MRINPVTRCSGWAEDKYFCKSFSSYNRLNLRMFQNGFGLRTEDQCAILVAVEQRFDAKPISRKKYMLPYTIPDCESKDSVKLMNGVRSPFDISLQQHFRITLSPKFVTSLP
ncbi:hypothetical protein D3C81_1269730 [compost metagenome]